jgi:hypothetical protein
MYNYTYAASLDTRDVIAAWLVCLAIVVAAFVYPGFSPDPAREAQTALRSAAPAVSQVELCAVRDKQIMTPRG